MNNIKVYILLVFVLIYNTGHTQNYHEDIAMIYKKIESAVYFEIKANILVYNSKKDKNLLLKLESNLKRKGKVFRSMTDGVETISNKDFIAIVDNNEKSVQVQNTQKISKKDQKLLDEFASLGDIKTDSTVKVTLLESKGGIHKYKITSQQNEIETTTISFDVNKNSILQIELEYNSKVQTDARYVVINYTKFSYPEIIEERYFTAKDILLKKGKTFYLVGKYKSYELTNLYQ